MELPKPVSVRSPKYLKWIRQQKCVVKADRYSTHFLSDRRAVNCVTSEAAHVWPSSMGKKSSDICALPLCAYFHRSDSEGLDKIGREEFERRHSLDLDKEIIRHLIRYIKETGGDF